MEIRIDKYQQNDLPAMLAIWNNVVNQGLAFPQERPETHETGEKFFAAQSYCGIAKEKESGQIVGLYILHPNNIGRCGHICNCSYAVAENARGQGVGRKLVIHSLKQGKELGFTIMQFNAVAADNETANGLYKKLGFNSLGTISGGFRRDPATYIDINLYWKAL